MSHNKPYPSPHNSSIQRSGYLHLSDGTTGPYRHLERPLIGGHTATLNQINKASSASASGELCLLFF